MNAPSRHAFATRPYPADAEITIRGLKKLFGGSPVYEDFDLDVPKGAIVSVFGPNGCGKSTLINIVSGLMPHDGGQILFDGKTIAETRLAYVFQNYREALFPWLKSIDNIRYPLKLMGLPRKEQDIRIERLLAAMEVKFDLNRYPYELSGGQQQTISIMRALVVEPEVLFLDEPFSALDYEMTLSMRDRLQSVFIETGVTMMLVSHDLEEAIYMADRILLLTRRPTRIAAYLEFNAPRPRTATTLTDPSFISLKRESLEIFQREVGG